MLARSEVLTHSLRSGMSPPIDLPCIDVRSTRETRVILTKNAGEFGPNHVIHKSCGRRYTIDYIGRYHASFGVPEQGAKDSLHAEAEAKAEAEAGIQGGRCNKDAPQVALI